MGKCSSPYPQLVVGGSGSGVVSQAGAALLLRTAESVGLITTSSRVLSPWRKPLAVHDPGKIVLDLAVAVALGGDCLADIGLARVDVGRVWAGGLGSNRVAADHRAGRGSA